MNALALAPDNPLKPLAKELERRRAARENFYSFLDYFADSDLNETGHTPAKHHRLIIDHAVSMVDGSSKTRTLVVNAPPGCAKSVYSSILFPCWLLAKDPKAQIICIAATDALSERFSRARRQIIESEQFKRLSNTELTASSLSMITTSHGGYIASRGIGASIVGLRATAIICDDPVVSIETAMSPTQLQKIWDYWTSEAATRLKPDGIVILVSTKWAQSDLSGRLVSQASDDDPEGTEYIRLPLLCDDEANDPLGRSEGECLWSDWYTEAMISRAQKNPMIFKTLWQQQAVDTDGLFIPVDKLNIIDPEQIPSPMTYVAAIDLAYSPTKGDYSVIAIVGLSSKREMVVVDVWRERVTSDTSADKLIAFCKQFDLVTAVIDNDLASVQWSKLLYHKARESGVAVPLQFLKLGNRSKTDRAVTLRSTAMQDQLLLVNKPWLPVVQDEILGFPAASHDDCVDALSLAARILQKLSTPTGAAKLEQGEIETQVQEIGGQLYTAQSLNDLWESNTRQQYSFQKTRL
jgi:predicted phage terminase large subunit-like protein